MTEGDLRSRRSCCALIRQMSIEDPLWGAPRIHGELLEFVRLGSTYPVVEACYPT